MNYPLQMLPDNYPVHVMPQALPTVQGNYSFGSTVDQRLMAVTQTLAQNAMANGLVGPLRSITVRACGEWVNGGDRWYHNSGFFGLFSSTSPPDNVYQVFTAQFDQQMIAVPTPLGGMQQVPAVPGDYGYRTPHGTGTIRVRRGEDGDLFIST